MNRFALSLALILSPVTLLSQLPTESFESWIPNGAAEVPVGWGSNQFGVGRSSDAHSGAYAASVWNWYSYAKGYIMTGADNPFYSDLVYSGIPITYKPVRLSGYYKFVPDSVQSSNDSAVVYIMLKRYNPQKQDRDTVAYVKRLLGPAAAYTPFSIDIPDMAPGVMPDSIVIAFVSSENGFCNSQFSGTCCYFTIDDLTLASTSGVQYSADWMLRSLRVYPNPMRSSMRLEFDAEPVGHDKSCPYRVLIYSINGELVRRIDDVRGCVVNIDRSGWAGGEYLVEVRDEGDGIVGRGRVVVE